MASLNNFMFYKLFIYLKKFDFLLFVPVFLLLIFSLAEIYSIALSNDSLGLINFKKQAFFIFLGMIILFLLVFFDYYNFRSFGSYLYIFGVLILVVVLFFGKTVRSTRAWFQIGSFSVQPVEFIKIILILFLARYFSGVSIKLSPFKHLLISGALSGILISLVFLQPDFGSAMILFALWFFMAIFAGFKKRYLFLIVLILFTVFISGWLFFFKDYQKERIKTFLNPSENSLAEGYNVNQAIIAVGSGGIMGRGIGFGSQSQLKFLPESQNDFIFAVISEELGFLGVFLVFAFFSLIFARLIIAIKYIKNDFGIYFIMGTISLIFIQMFINIGMNIGLLPVIGISLPFLSYGGSAIISNMILIGISESIIIRSKIKY